MGMLTVSGTLKKKLCSHSGSYIITPQACRNPFGLVKLLQLLQRLKAKTSPYPTSLNPHKPRARNLRTLELEPYKP